MRCHQSGILNDLPTLTAHNVTGGFSENDAHCSSLTSFCLKKSYKTAFVDAVRIQIQIQLSACCSYLLWSYYHS